MPDHKVNCPLHIFTKALCYKDFIKYVDNYVNNVHKGHTKNSFHKTTFIENMLENKDISVKDIKI